MSKVNKEQEIERIEVETADVERAEVERAEVPTVNVEFEPIEDDEPKLGPVKRFKKRMHEFGERHPKAVSVLKGVGVFGIAFLTGFAAATVNERRKWIKEGVQDSLGDNCMPFPEGIECDDVTNVPVETEETVSMPEIPDDISGVEG